MVIIPICCLLVSFLVWFVLDRNTKVEKTKEFYPPEGLNSIDVGYIYKGYIVDRNVFSLILYLANKGYLIFVEGKKRGIGFLKNIKIIMENNEQRLNGDEARYLDMLFIKKISLLSAIIKKQFSQETEKEIKLSNLSDYFYKMIAHLLRKYRVDIRNKYFTETWKSRYVVIIICMLITFCDILTVPMVNRLTGSDLGLYIFQVFILGLFFTPMVYHNIPFVLKSMYTLCICIIIYFNFKTYNTFNLIINNKYYMEVAGVGILCLCGMLYFLSRIPKRTEETLDVYIKIKGLVNFIKHASSEEIDKLSEENPNYFYDILPYAYSLGLYKTWIRKLKKDKVKQPSWYVGDELKFNLKIFSKIIRRLIIKMNINRLVNHWIYTK